MEEEKGMYSKHLMPSGGGLFIATLVPVFILLVWGWVLYLGGKIY